MKAAAVTLNLGFCLINAIYVGIEAHKGSFAGLNAMAFVICLSAAVVVGSTKQK